MRLVKRYHYIYIPRARPQTNGHQEVNGNLYAEQLEQAAVDRDLALARVEAAADEEWKDYAYDFLYQWCVNNPEMFTDELWALGLEEPREPRALGPVVLKLQRQGIIVRTVETRPRAKGNLAYGPVWRSLIYRHD